MSTSLTQNYFNINVTQLAQVMVDTPATNYGFHFQLKTETYYRKLNFCSSDWTVASTRPKITIIYTNPTVKTYFRDSVSLGNDTTLCDTNFNLTAGVSAGVYLWNTGDTTQTIKVKQSGIYFVEVIKNCKTFRDTIVVTVIQGNNLLSSDTNLCVGDSLRVNINISGASYLWSNGSTDSSITINLPGTYWVRAMANGCIFYDTINVAFIPYPIVNIGNDTLICSSSLILNAGITGSSYLWNNSSFNQTNIATTSGVYWVDVSNGNCITRDSIRLSFVDLDFDLGNDTILCDKAALVLSPGVLAKSYLWNTGATTSSILVNSSGQYTLVTSDSVCTSVDSIIVLFQNLNSRFNASPLSGCSSLLVNFQDLTSINFGSITNWNWDFGEGGTSSSQNPNYTYSIPGVYSVKLSVTSAIGCFDDTTINNLITVHPRPTADFEIVSSPIFIGQIILFNDKSIGAISYTWFVDSLFLSSTQNSSTVFKTFGVFNVDLITVNSFGCKDTIRKQIRVSELNRFFAPNSFTPNQNALNESWKVYANQDIISFELRIFNRWGEEIFMSNSIKEAWDGTHLGIECPIGDYIWHAKIQFHNLIIEDKFGHINLIR